jgi:hypothetical protein
MKLDLTLTPKDRKLLVVLGVFVVVVGFCYWGIRPVVTKINRLNEQIEDEKDVQALNELKISELPLLRTDNEKLEGQIEDARNYYYDIMTSDEVDKYFTNMVLSYNLNSYDLTIQMPTECSALRPYQYSEKMALQQQNEETEEDAEEEEDLDNGIYTATVEMRLGGDISELTRLLDSLFESDRRLRVSNYYYTTQQTIQTEENGSYAVLENSVLNLTVEIYMCAEDSALAEGE